jgi:hypothetical protein
MKLAHGAFLFGAIAGEVCLKRSSAQDHETIAPFHPKVGPANDLHHLPGQGGGNLHLIGQWTD